MWGIVAKCIKTGFFNYCYYPQKSENMTFRFIHSISSSHCAVPVKMFSSKWSAFWILKFFHIKPSKFFSREKTSLQGQSLIRCHLISSELFLHSHTPRSYLHLTTFFFFFFCECSAITQVVVVVVLVAKCSFYWCNRCLVRLWQSK